MCIYCYIGHLDSLFVNEAENIKFKFFALQIKEQNRTTAVKTKKNLFLDYMMMMMMKKFTVEKYKNKIH